MFRLPTSICFWPGVGRIEARRLYCDRSVVVITCPLATIGAQGAAGRGAVPTGNPLLFRAAGPIRPRRRQHSAPFRVGGRHGERSCRDESPAIAPTRGFTLIELLVVISIIALLISILLPALRAARESAQAVACGSNLRQIGTAMHVYVNDSNGRLPLRIYTSIKHPTAPGLREVLGYGGQVLSTMDFDTVFTCPSLQQMLPSVQPLHVTYSQNQFTTADYAAGHHRIDSVPSPEKTMFVMDGRYTGPGNYAGTIRSSATMLVQLIYPHHDRQNAVFLDAHVEQIEETELLGWNARSLFWNRTP